MLDLNKRGFIISAIFLICVIAIGSILYSTKQTLDIETEEKIRVVVTIVPQAQFVEKVGGDRVSVTVLVPPGASPHTYEPAPSQMMEVAKAEMYAKVGSGIDFELTWMDKIISTNPSMLVVDCSQGIQLIDMATVNDHEEHDHIGKDPHIWLSPKNAMIMVDNIYEGLVKIDPDNNGYYSQNKDAYIKALRDLDNNISNTFSGMATKKFMVYHPSWGYLAKEYGLEMIPIEEEGKAPTPEGMARLVKQAKENKIKVIFATPEFETKTAETIAHEIDGSVVLTSPLEKDYINMLTKISNEIARALM